MWVWLICISLSFQISNLFLVPMILQASMEKPMPRALRNLQIDMACEYLKYIYMTEVT